VGVGAAQGRFLRAGDLVEVEVEGLGVVRNGVRAE
jgi:2-keto-4-pentenoate hydratase/2-oxohepta-3-ene-1,7-dioic acid hydratase in catechol pathway